MAEEKKKPKEVDINPETASVFEVLNSLNVNEYTEKVENEYGKQISYLSWARAWGNVQKYYPDAQYEVVKNENNLPYFYDEKTGYMVYTRVTIKGVTREMWLPVMNSSNKAMKAEPYKYSTKKGERTVDAANMFDINKTIMRCLAKNLAVFGLGLYIYSKEDIPESEKEELKAEEESNRKEAAEKIIKERIKELRGLYSQTTGKDFDKWYMQSAPDGLTDKTYASMKVTLMNQINKQSEKSAEKPAEKTAEDSAVGTVNYTQEEIHE
ncbi:MAG: DUF1071 domain-containing protein [Clostridiales bacterium]|nr:DUF1071 domain-containing protein [Clostridiales bacterium]